MTNEEIQKHIEQNCRNAHGEPMMDEQAFYEGAKWMRDKALSLTAVVKPKGTVCDHKKVQPYFAPVDECEDCGELIRQ